MVSLKKPSLGNKILYEIAIGIVAVILLLGVLNTVTHTEKIPLVTTEDLLDNSFIHCEWRNSTDSKFIKYNLSDVATYYNGYLYISLIPPDSEYTTPRGFSIYYFGNYTVSDLIDRGFNLIEIELEPINDTPLMYNVTWPAGYLTIRAEKEDASWIWCQDLVLIKLTESTSDNNKKYNVTFGSFNKSVDIGNLLVKATSAGVLNSKVGMHVWTGDVRNLEGIKLKINLYATSEKPILKMFTEPAYGIIAGLWSTLVALYNRIRQYALSFFGGFSISALFTGLIGDPVTALVITAIVIVVFFFALTRPAPRRRHD